MDQEYKNKVTRKLYEAIWTFMNSVNETKQIKEVELGKIIYNAVENSMIVSGTIDEEFERRNKIKF